MTTYQIDIRSSVTLTFGSQTVLTVGGFECYPSVFVKLLN